MLSLISKRGVVSLLAPAAAAAGLRLGRPWGPASFSSHPEPLPVEGVPDNEANPEQPLEDSHSQAPRKKIFDDLGGAKGLKLAVDKFYNKVLDDDELLPYFLPVDMKKQKSKQVQFMSFVFGGPEKYEGRDMYTTHKDMVENQGLRHRHFDKIKLYLVETLQEMGVKQDVIDHAAAVVESTRADFRFPDEN